MNSSSEASEDDEICTSSDIADVVTTINLLPQKSKSRYEKAYRVFMDWRSLKKLDSFSENVLLAYFEELAEKYKPPSLWSLYSMLRNTLIIHNSVSIGNYSKLRAFLKSKSAGYQAEKVKTFTSDEVDRFVNEAPDNKYLVAKVALIMGIMGACRPIELYSMNIEDLQDLGSAMLVSVRRIKTNSVRKFTITDRFYEICKKYVDGRPTNAPSAFFLNYHDGKCTAQNIGINKFGAMGKEIATFLKLPDPEMYTGHSFRILSSALHESRRNKKSANTAAQETVTANKIFNFDIKATPSVRFTNCSNITINFVKKSQNKIVEK